MRRFFLQRPDRPSVMGCLWEPRFDDPHTPAVRQAITGPWSTPANLGRKLTRAPTLWRTAARARDQPASARSGSPWFIASEATRKITTLSNHAEASPGAGSGAGRGVASQTSMPAAVDGELSPHAHRTRFVDSQATKRAPTGGGWPGIAPAPHVSSTRRRRGSPSNRAGPSDGPSDAVRHGRRSAVGVPLMPPLSCSGDPTTHPR